MVYSIEDYRRHRSVKGFRQIVRYEVSRVRLNAQGYDSCGAYWGAGNPLYYVFDTVTGRDMYLRARDAKHARLVYMEQSQ